MNTTLKIASGVIVGSVIGATLGLLFAPKKGTKTRAMISGKAKDLSAKARNTYVKAKDLVGIKTNHKEKVMA